LLVFLALSIVVITLDFRDDTGGPLDGARAASTAAIAPLQEAVGTVLEPVGDFFSSLANLGSLREENARLRERLAQMEQRVAEADSIVSENRRLVALNGLDAAYPSMKRVSARVIGRPPANYRWAVTIDLGSNDGIAADMPVIHPHGLVGKVLSVDASTATVLLLVDPASAAKARVGAHGAVGAITGNGGGQPLSLSFIDVDAQVRVGDAVLTSGSGPRSGHHRLTQRAASAMIGGDARSLQLDPVGLPGVRPLVLFTVVVLAVTIQSTLLAEMTLLGVVPQLALVVVVGVALLEGPRAGVALGFAAGLLQDLLLPGSIAGMTAFVYSLVAYGAGTLQSPPSDPAPGFVTAVVAAATLAAELGYALLAIVLGREWVSLGFTARVALLVVIYNSLLTPLVLPVVRHVAVRVRPRRLQRC
jgi:rod shape-determining protein MreC/rod shape-determining protein MreD